MRGTARRVFWRVLVAALLTTAGVAMVFGEFYWTLYDLTAYDPITGAHPEFISTPVSALSEPIAKHTWRIFPGLTETLIGSGAAIGLFILLGGRRICLRSETRCGECGTVLRNLIDAKCPACRQPL